MKHRMRKLQVAITLSVLVMMMITSLASATVPTYVDYFNGSYQNIVVPSGSDGIFPKDNTTPYTGSASDSSVMGVERDIIATMYDAANFANLEATVAGGKITIAGGSNMLYSVEIQWDGSDASPAINTSGFSPAKDLTTSPARDRFILVVSASDMGGDVIFRIYTSDSRCSETTITIQGTTVDPDNESITASNQKVYEVPYSSLTTICDTYGSLATPTSVTAVSLTFKNNVGQEGWDVVAEMFATGSDTFRDFGDLPQDGSSYRYEQNNNGGGLVHEAAHIESALHLGTLESYEASKMGSGLLANADSDEDASGPNQAGVRATGNWKLGTNGGEITVFVSGCGDDGGTPPTLNNCYLTGFIDWRKDGDFNTSATPATTERILANYPVHDGANPITFNIPSRPDGMTSDLILAGNTFYARFRLTDATVTTGYPTGTYLSGSVEDYRWTFGTTAMTLAKLDATSSSASSALPFAALLLPVGLGILLVSRRRK
jgi:hypothetical protein